MSIFHLRCCVEISPQTQSAPNGAALTTVAFLNGTTSIGSSRVVSTEDNKKGAIHERATRVAWIVGCLLTITSVTVQADGERGYGGDLDFDFGIGGGVALAHFAHEDGRGMAIQADGKIVVGGHAYNLASPGHDFAAARFLGVELLFDGFESGDTSVWSSAVP